ncbi:MAG: hypothetical protein V7K21_26035 [Nostoc sp.]|uniref:hypothetical protein n=1 Tax=Nostoc sp. TaxID=1180 RepID=UPI002FF63C67
MIWFRTTCRIRPYGCEVNYLNRARTSSVMVDGTTAKGGVSLLLSRVKKFLGTEF